MRKISEHSEQKFYEVLKYKVSIQNFEQWVYNTKELEMELPPNSYLELISLNFKGKYIYLELEKVISQFVNNGKFEIKRLQNHLKSIIYRDEKCAESIEMTYDLYCAGYNFLRRLGLIYGLSVASPPIDDYTKTWKEISRIEQEGLLNKLYPKIILDAQNALNWIENGKIIIKDSINEYGNYEYEDLRNKEEIEQGEIEVNFDGN
ncbi:hypothetical protein Fleli_3235 [Bernardetia litoralis DSM 6794]|uniref:Uncharacterized protein n=1 Tax=Bernardetia litoralis (strain ATCC 23117 / DSM 6794 / NBRC 15988 / NCIMB 1366 / Fx l1 / Sio-4) TaxID=880071 RepID=I4ANN1_BERLS|nr:hypothetical protein [Bernardetia litoralis]AFM05566.1 hypothetical protein Fleli_3235 [Bernardetia litoralis DSM 6794]